MKERIDFTYCEPGYKTYGGANGAKRSIYYGGELYMLKFPHAATRNPNLHYSNDIMSEHLGSTIFNILGIQAQETILGIYREKDKEGNVKTYDIVACKDFADTRKGLIFQDFASLKNEVVSSPTGGYNTDIDELEDAFEKQTRYDSEKLREFFWDMFIVDAYLGNFDRHNGNWGFIVDVNSDKWSLAPVYDCGSCLYAQADDETKKRIMTSEQDLKIRIYQRPLSALSYNGKKIGYAEFLASGANDACTKALIRMSDRINSSQNAISSLLEETPLSPLDIRFYTYMLSKRRELILEPALRKIHKTISTSPVKESNPANTKPEFGKGLTKWMMEQQMKTTHQKTDNKNIIDK